MFFTPTLLPASERQNFVSLGLPTVSQHLEQGPVHSSPPDTYFLSEIIEETRAWTRQWREVGSPVEGGTRQVSEVDRFLGEGA